MSEGMKDLYGFLLNWTIEYQPEVVGYNQIIYHRPDGYRDTLKVDIDRYDSELHWTYQFDEPRKQ